MAGFVRWLAGGLAVAALLVPATASATFPGENGKIAYQGPGVSGTSGASIFSMNGDGSEKANLTPNSASAPARRGGGPGSFDPAYSADGRKIVFERVIKSSQSQTDIWIMNADGSGATNATNTAGVNEYDPALSPDGTKIVFVRTAASGPNELSTMNVNGTGVSRLAGTAALENPASPEFSPDGTKIAFAAGSTRNDIYTIGSNGQGLANLTSAVTGSNYDPSWSPDGSRIAFETFVSQPTSRGDILVIGADGGATTNLTAGITGTLFVESPSFSPDGKLIAYSGSTGGPDDDDVYTMRSSDGLQQTNITSDSTAQDGMPNWGPVPVNTPPPADSDPPDTAITKQPENSDKTSAKLAFSSSEPGSTFECALKGKDVKASLKEFKPCNSGKVKYRHLEPGKKKFSVRATDSAGNVDQTPAKAKWTVLS